MNIKYLEEWHNHLGGEHRSTNNTDILNAIQLNNPILLEILKKMNK